MSRRASIASGSFDSYSRTPSPRRGRGARWLIVGLFGCGLLAWFAPAIVVNTGLRDALLRTALQDFPGQIRVSGMSADWLTGVELRGITVADSQGQELVTVARVASSKSLIGLLLDRREIGTVRVDQPVGKLVLRPDGSNWEDLLLPWLQAETKSSRVGCTVEVVDGSLEVQAAEGSGPWQFTGLTGTVRLPQDPAAAWAASLKTAIAAAQRPEGALQMELEWQPREAGLPVGKLGLQCQGMPLEITAPLLRRTGQDLNLAGQLSADLQATLGDTGQSLTVKQLTVQDFQASSATLLGTDQPRLTTVTGKGEIHRGTTGWQFRQVVLQSDLGSWEATGAGPANGAPTLLGELTQAFRQGVWEVRGSADLARLTSQLPRTLRLKDGTHFSAGQLAASLESEAGQQGHVWNVAVEASQLAALHAGKPITWQKPLTLKAAVTERAGGMVVDQLQCDSSFLKLAGSGTMAQGGLRVEGDLSQFVAEVGRFLDLGGLTAAGQFRGDVTWKTAGAGQPIELTGQGSATQFELTLAPDRPWQEPQLTWSFSGAARGADGKLSRVESGLLRIVAGADQLEAQLRQPVEGVASTTAWPCHVRLQGDLGRWLTRLRLFGSLDPWVLDADEMQLEGDLVASLQRCEYTGVRGSAKNFEFRGAGLTIREPVLQIESTGVLDIAQETWTTAKTVAMGSTVSFSAADGRLLYGGDHYALDGVVNYRANLERLLPWFLEGQAPTTFRLQGESTGVARLQYDGQATQADVTGSVDKFVLARPSAPNNAWQEWWQEPRLELAAKGSLSADATQVKLEKLEAAGEALSIGAAGTIRELTTRCQLDLSGQYAYDLQRLAQRFRGALGDQVQLAGTGQRPFSVKGPLFSLAADTGTRQVQPVSVKTAASPSSAVALQELMAEASVGWDKIVVHGFDIGRGEVATKLGKGLVEVSPISLPVSEGKIQFSPRLDVTKTPYEVRLSQGTVVDQVRISPEMCRSWLKYLAPLMANATAAEGRFSVQIDDSHFPLSDPTGGSVQGRFIVHSAQIGPGPLSQEILSLVQTIRAALDKQPLGAITPGTASPGTAQWLDMPEQQLNFQLADHRVYHRDMRFVVKDVAVTTSGWVGLDQQLALVADIPIREEWVAKDRYLASLKGQSLKLPIGGSLSRPVVDRTAIRELTRQTVINAGSNLLQQELNKGLNRLLQPKK